MNRTKPALTEPSSRPSTATALLGLGANLGDAAQTLLQAFEAIRDLPQVGQARLASLYRSAPVDAPGPTYSNSAVALRTTLSPLALLDQIQQIEHRFGRVRSTRNAPRTLDIDLLCYDSISIDVPRLILPHPRLHQRAFVLMPLIELLGEDFQIDGKTAAHWLENCKGQDCFRMSWPSQHADHAA